MNLRTRISIASSNRPLPPEFAECVSCVYHKTRKNEVATALSFTLEWAVLFVNEELVAESELDEKKTTPP